MAVHRVEHRGHLPAPRGRAAARQAAAPRVDRRGLRRPRARRPRPVHRDHPAEPVEPVLGVEGRGRPAGPCLDPFVRDHRHPLELLEQLRPVPARREVHPPPDHQHPVGDQAQALRHRGQRPRLDPRRRPQRRRAHDHRAGPERRDLPHRRRRRARQPPDRGDPAGDHGQAGRLVRPRPRSAGPRPPLRHRLLEAASRDRLGAPLSRRAGGPRADGRVVPRQRGMVVSATRPAPRPPTRSSVASPTSSLGAHGDEVRDHRRRTGGQLRGLLRSPPRRPGHGGRARRHRRRRAPVGLHPVQGHDRHRRGDVVQPPHRRHGPRRAGPGDRPRARARSHPGDHRQAPGPGGAAPRRPGRAAAQRLGQVQGAPRARGGDRRRRRGARSRRRARRHRQPAPHPGVGRGRRPAGAHHPARLPTAGAAVAPRGDRLGGHGRGVRPHVLLVRLRGHARRQPPAGAADQGPRGGGRARGRVPAARRPPLQGRPGHRHRPGAQRGDPKLARLPAR